VRFIGMSGTLPHLPDHIAMGVFDVFQVPYSVLQREHEDLISAAARAGAGTLIRGGVGRGTAAADKGWGAEPFGFAEGEARRRWNAAGMENVLEGMTPMEFMLRFTLSHPSLSAAVVGTCRLEHLRYNLTTAEMGPLPCDLYEEAKRRFGRN
jgi:aryl-alcohol dehydrogenase-like predicted oxidoreductase